jgi:hypothetical protein
MFSSDFTKMADKVRSRPLAAANSPAIEGAAALRANWLSVHGISADTGY